MYSEAVMVILFILLLIWVVVFTILYFKVEVSASEPADVKVWLRFISVQAFLFVTTMVAVGWFKFLDFAERQLKAK